MGTGGQEIKAKMKEILVGWCEEDQRIHVCFEVESMELMKNSWKNILRKFQNQGTNKKPPL